MQGHANHAAAIITAVAEMSAKRYVEHAVQNTESATLILVTRMETLALCSQRLANVDRPTL